MPKIPWTRPPRPPRIVPDPDPIAEFHPAPQGERCDTCVGMGVLYRQGAEVRPIECWICKGTGKALPPPPEGDLHSDGSEPLTWQGSITGRIRGSGGTHNVVDLDYNTIELRALRWLAEQDGI